MSKKVLPDDAATVESVPAAGHAELHTVASHSDTGGTGPELDALTDGSNADALHSHVSPAHTIASHSDTTATGPELETLTDGSDADALHTHPAITGDVVHADNGNAAIAINSLTDVVLATTDVTGVVAGDLLIAELWGTLLNNSGVSRTYTFTGDFDNAFDPEIAIATGSNATDQILVRARWLLGVESTSKAYLWAEHMMTDTDVATGVWLANNELNTDRLWETTANDLTGTITVNYKIRSNDAAATQSFFVNGFVVRKISST